MLTCCLKRHNATFIDVHVHVPVHVHDHVHTHDHPHVHEHTGTHGHTDGSHVVSCSYLILIVNFLKNGNSNPMSIKYSARIVSPVVVSDGVKARGKLLFFLILRKQRLKMSLLLCSSPFPYTGSSLLFLYNINT